MIEIYINVTLMELLKYLNLNQKKTLKMGKTQAQEIRERPFGGTWEMGRVESGGVTVIGM